MPAAAVIPAPIAYTKVVAIKKLVVGSQAWAHGPPRGGHCVYVFPSISLVDIGLLRLRKTFGSCALVDQVWFKSVLLLFSCTVSCPLWLY